MSTNRTSNYSLCQWQPDDKVLRTDFNEDNCKIDAALASLAASAGGLSSGKADKSAVDALSATVSQHTAELSKKGNCQLYVTSYTGSGRHGEANANSLTFPASPAVVCIGRGGGWLVMVQGAEYSWVVGGASGRGVVNITWSGKTLRWYSDSAEAQMNSSSMPYTVIAFIQAG